MDNSTVRKPSTKTRNKELVSLIYGKFSTMAEMAAAVGWTRAKLSKIINGQEPSLTDFVTFCRTLDCAPNRMLEIFLGKKFPYGNQESVVTANV